MTEQEKQLLLVDLCARLTYEVPIIPNGQVTPHKIVDIDFNKEVVIVQPIDRELMGVGCLGFEDFKMILRPMSSMTEEEHRELSRLVNDNKLLTGDPAKTVCLHCGVVIDFHNSHHLDWRGLIPMGLALEAPEGMYN